MEEVTDEAITKRVQQGDVEAFALLMDRYEKKITRYARKFLSQPDDVKDIVQDVFVKVYVNIKSFDVKRRFSPWIYRIAHNEFVNALKKNKASKLSQRAVVVQASFGVSAGIRISCPPTAFISSRIMFMILFKTLSPKGKKV